MQTSTKWLIGILGFLGLAVLVAILALVGLLVVQSGETEQPAPIVAESPTPAGEAPIADGEWFGFVSVGEDETGAITPSIDLADMLTGQEAHDAAVEAGIITPDEDLPNDFFIENEASVLELMSFSDDAELKVVSADDVSTHIDVTAEQLAALYNGTYVGGDVYGVAVGEPIPMDITIENGEIVSAIAIYLP